MVCPAERSDDAVRAVALGGHTSGVGRGAPGGDTAYRGAAGTQPYLHPGDAARRPAVDVHTALAAECAACQLVLPFL